MPQPLSKVKSIKFSIWGTIAMSERPLLALAITQVIAAWAETELRLAGLLAIFLKSEMPTGMSMYLNLTSAESRRAVLNGAAQKALTAEKYELYSKTMRAIKPVRDRRNEFAHGIWGFCHELPDALLWVNQNIVSPAI
jgi:hypothetical protein